MIDNIANWFHVSRKAVIVTIASSIAGAAILIGLLYALRGEILLNKVEVNTRISLSEGFMVNVQNRDGFDWDDVTMKVNGDYSLHMDTMAAGNTYTFGLEEFAKKDGTQFNGLTTEPFSFSISCKTPDGRGTYRGGWS